MLLQQMLTNMEDVWMLTTTRMLFLEFDSFNFSWKIFKTPPEDADPSEIRCPLPSAPQPVTDKFTPGVNHTSLDVSSQNQQPIYMNKAPALPYTLQKPKLRSVDIYNPTTERKSETLCTAWSVKWDTKFEFSLNVATSSPPIYIAYFILS